MYRYSPGTWFGVLTPGAVAMVPGSLGTQAALAVRDAAGEGGGFPAMLEALAGASGASFAQLPDFAIAVREGERIRVAIRGGLDVRCGGEVISGEGISTWAERLLPLEGGLEIRAAEARNDSVGLLPAYDAVVLCDIVHIGETTTPEPVPQARIDAEPAQVPAVAVEPASDVPVEDVVDDSMTLVPEDTTVNAAAEDRHAVAHSVEPTPVAHPAPTVPEDHSGADDYDDLFGATVMRHVEDAAVRIVDEGVDGATEVAKESAPTTEPDPGASLPEPSPDLAPDLAAAASSWTAPVLMPDELQVSQPSSDSPAPAHSDGDLIAGIPLHLTGDGPGRSAPAPSPEPERQDPAPPALQEGDHDGMTVSVAQLRAMRQQAPAATSGCVGRAVVSTGETVSLDRSVILGRRPKSMRSTGDVPHLITVPSPQQDISRSHLELRVQGTAVLAVDLDTTNGTVLRRPGKDPVRLHPQEPTILLSGDALDLGEGVSVAVEDLA
ncbi:FHA domain-containing protein [Demequina sp. NBRC 110054]|uniref:FHA domain-containing protein n=1 Tax=Demequina sp. NBRC 110054 TaxID=1570343 RepID=UPI0009FC6220|nr:FHA domain-containing protein [Demequina sp. NBRC 110054]